ncbi:MAG: 1-phosphofructokinase family hexose kinase [Candidatus Omnitrophica bacterium]|nr:1-phosphofructokinase family hexose kinase [Candidatus Omnitrophota bacterium]MCM8768310.1 1-phosphofructokinase family hexose kinase [Candidatus Omnitrophota bacterium]
MEKNSRIFTVSLNTSLDRTFYTEKIVFGDINRITTGRLDAGGKGLNVARMLHRLGNKVEIVVCLGGDNGKVVARLATGEGLVLRPITTQGETRNIFNFIETCSGRILRINEPGPVFSKREKENLFRKLNSLPLGSSDILVLSGSLPPGLPEDTYQRIINQIKSKTTFITLDADGQVLKKGVQAGPWLIKPNLWELARLLGGKVTSLNQLVRYGYRLMKRTGLKLILLTLGQFGALSLSSQHLFWAKPPRVKPISEVGCGDAFLAGFLHGYKRNWALEECLMFAVACGTAKVLCPGTGMPSLKQVFSLKKQVTMGQPEKLNLSFCYNPEYPCKIN